MCHSFLPDPEAITFQVQTTAQQATCPKCATTSDRTHSWYTRTIQDLSWQGDPVRFELTLRKFFCDNQDCQRRIFAQPLSKIARRYQRKTTRLESVLLRILWKVGARDAFFVAKLLGIVISDDATLDQFKKAPEPGCSETSPEEIGIDGFAFRKGQTYGTIIDSTPRPNGMTDEQVRYALAALGRRKNDPEYLRRLEEGVAEYRRTTQDELERELADEGKK